MTVKTIYKCDLCGKEWERGDQTEQAVAVGISIKFGYPTIGSGTYPEQQMWCRTCIMKKGIHPPQSDEDRKIAPPTLPSFEERFTELLLDLGFIMEE